VIDFAWPGQMVAVEFDGFVPHAGRPVFDDDRERQNELVDAGWRVYRLTSTACRVTAGARSPGSRPHWASICSDIAHMWNRSRQISGPARAVATGYRRSTIIAMPWPPPTHMLSMP
jgi:hypothetical protein